MAEELVNNSHRQMKDDEGRRIAAVEAFSLAKKRIQKLNTKLTEANRERKSAEAALHGVEKQAESQRRQLRQIEDQLSVAREHIEILKKKLQRKLSKTATTLGWQRLRKPLRLRSLKFVGPTASQYGMRPSTELEWRPSLP